MEMDCLVPYTEGCGPVGFYLRALNEYLKQGAFRIIDAMNEGLHTVQRAIAGHQKWTSKPDGYSKIMVFMMARTISLIFLRRKRLKHYKCKPDVDTALRSSYYTQESDEGDISLIGQCLLLLIKIRSLSIVVRGFIDDTSTRSSLDDGRLKLFEMIVALGLRVDVYAAKLICSANIESIRVGLECLARLPSEEFNVALSINGEDDNAVKSENVFSLGRLFVVKNILENLRSTASNFCCGGISSTTSVQLCETVIFEDLPSCYHFFQLLSPCGIDLPTWVGTFLGDFVGILENFIRTFFVSENQENYRNAIIRQHKLILRWLADAQRSRAKCAPLHRNHPFSNEIIMSILHTRVMSSYASCGKSVQDRSDLISLFAKLLFDDRTESSHRRLLATFLARLLRSSNFISDGKWGWESELTNAKLDTIRIMWRELMRSPMFNLICVVTTDTCSSGKRRRKSSCSSAPDACEIYWVLGILVEASISSQKVIDGAVVQIMRQLLENILTSSQSNHTLYHHGRFNHNQCFVVSLLLGAMRSHPNIEALQRMLHGEDVIKKAHPFTFIDGSLTLIDSFLSCGQSKSRMISLYYASVQFIGALISFLKIEFSENHVTRIGIILNSINSAISTIPAFEKVRVQHLMISAVCDIGDVVPPKISTESVTPLIDIISRFLEKSNWFYVSPCLTLSEKFVKTLPSNYRGLLSTAMPFDAKLLLTSRIQGTLFCLISGQKVDDMKLFNTPYALRQESKFMHAHCTRNNRSSRSCFGDRIIQLREGSKLFFRNQTNGNISILVMAPSVSFQTHNPNDGSDRCGQ
ncbi:hypothetical protein HJC23_006862 [Cyclotella cryptica]|uniref:Uncharacterized protein n=1 Tax=Cyclotella cryptica TaxID=29204 RepID=A0ABD3QCL5_9STRA